MEFALFVWLASVINALSGVLVFFAILLALAVVADLIITASHNGVYDHKLKFPFQKAWGKWCTAGALFLALLTSLIPSEKTMYVIAAAYGAQQVVHSEAAEKVVKIVNGKLDQYLEEIDKSVKEKVK